MKKIIVFSFLIFYQITSLAGSLSIDMTEQGFQYNGKIIQKNELIKEFKLLQPKNLSIVNLSEILKKIKVEEIISFIPLQIEIKVEKSLEPHLVFEGDKTTLDKITVQNINGQLIISSNSSVLFPINLKIYLKSLKKITLAKSSTVRGFISLDKLSINAQNDTKIYANGFIKKLHINSQGYNVFQLKNLITKDISINSNDNVYAEIFAIQTATINVKGTSSVHIYGPPREIIKKISSISSIIMH